jgi:hypothetical protein
MQIKSLKLLFQISLRYRNQRKLSVSKKRLATLEKLCVNIPILFCSPTIENRVLGKKNREKISKVLYLSLLQ